MNLLWNLLLVYLLPIAIYTMGKNEYAENADEHLLSQRSAMSEVSSDVYSRIRLFFVT